MAFRANLYVEAGATFTSQVTYANPDGTLFDLTGYSALLQVRLTPASASPVISVVPTIDVELATVSWTFSATQTALLTQEKYVYAIELANLAGEVIRLVEGDVTVSPQVVR